MNSRITFVIGIVALHATHACTRTEVAANKSFAGEDASTRVGSCDRVTNMSVCSEYSGANLSANEPVLGATCGKLGGVFVGAACPNTSVLGSCTLATGEVRKFYASGGAAYDVAKAQKECTGPYTGKWVAQQ